jgi:hypothetical protein
MRKVKCICCGEHIMARRYEADSEEIGLTERRLRHEYDRCSPKVRALGRPGSKSFVLDVKHKWSGSFRVGLCCRRDRHKEGTRHDNGHRGKNAFVCVFALDLVSCPPTVCVVCLLAQRFMRLFPCICDPRLHQNMFLLRLPVLLLMMISNGRTRMMTTVTRWSRRGVVGHDGHNQAP